jgi:hypothetical protein
MTKASLPHAIVLAAGMPRAGTGYYYNLLNQLWIAAGGQDGHEIRTRFHLQRILREVDVTIGSLNTKRTLAALVPVLLGNSYVVHLHFAPKPMGLFAIRRGWMIPTYIYRDPRDALLSAYEYGRRAEKMGRANPFTFLESIDQAIDFMAGYVENDWRAWFGLTGTLIFRYEDLITDYETQVNRLASHLGLDLTDPGLRDVVHRHHPHNVTKGAKGMHFNKGVIGRFREALSTEQQQRCAKAFGPYLVLMGYDI